MIGIKKALRPLVRGVQTWWRQLGDRRACRRAFAYDLSRYLKHSGAFGPVTRDARRAELVMGYHVIEKGLTMPRRRLGFGRWQLLRLMDLADAFVRDFGADDDQCAQAVAVVRAYEKLHAESGWDESADRALWDAVHDFSRRHATTQPAVEPHLTRQRLFADRTAAFPQFAASRRTVRHFGGPVADETIRAAVELAMTAPSACNRQHSRVHCVRTPALREQLMNVQSGCRGFGADADKFLVVTADLGSERWWAERHDAWVNAGIFLMNLSYSLHWHEVAHCILNWSVEPGRDLALRGILSIPPAEEIVAVVACGAPAEEMDIAASPRRQGASILTFH